MESLYNFWNFKSSLLIGGRGSNDFIYSFSFKKKNLYYIWEWKKKDFNQVTIRGGGLSSPPCRSFRLPTHYLVEFIETVFDLIFFFLTISFPFTGLSKKREKEKQNQTKRRRRMGTRFYSSVEPGDYGFETLILIDRVSLDLLFQSSWARDQLFQLIASLGAEASRMSSNWFHLQSPLLHV